MLQSLTTQANARQAIRHASSPSTQRVAERRFTRATRFSRLTDRAVRYAKTNRSRALMARDSKVSGMAGCRGVLFILGFCFDLGTFFCFEAFIF
jgi:hypothetical protein